MRKNILYAFVIVILCLSTFTGCDSTEYDTPNTLSNPTENDDTPVDISAYTGMPQLNISVDIEKDPDSHLFDCVAIVTNNSGKTITEMNLYLVKCYDNETPLNSWRYCDRLRINDLLNGATDRSRWVLGTTTEGASDYKVYLSFVQYEDGSTWGLSDIDHKTVVTRNAEVDVCVYDESTQTTEQDFLVTYSARIVSNSYVGNNWSYGMKVNDTFITPNTTISVDVANNRGPRFTVYGSENDDKDDYSQEDITFSKLNIGETATIKEQIVIVENNGRYTGHKAYMEFTVTVTRISTSVSPSNPSTDTVPEIPSTPTNPNDSTTQPTSASFEGSTCLDINTDTGMPLSNVTLFSLEDTVFIAGRLCGVTGENNLTIIWTHPNGLVEEVKQYYIVNNETINTGNYAEYMGVGEGYVSVRLDSTGEILATYYFTITN